MKGGCDARLLMSMGMQRCYLMINSLNPAVFTK